MLAEPRLLHARRIAVALFAISTASMTGCGTTMFSGRESNPVLQDFAIRIYGRASTLSTTASRRLALMVYDNDAEGRETVITCAEPPPDVAETFAKAFAAKLEGAASAKSAGIDSASLSGMIDSETATAVAPIFRRSQGVQVLRDSAYTLCVDRMNKWITSDDYIRMKDERFRLGLELIYAEMDKLPLQGSALNSPYLRPRTSANPAGGSASSSSASSPAKQQGDASPAPDSAKASGDSTADPANPTTSRN